MSINDESAPPQLLGVQVADNADNFRGRIRVAKAGRPQGGFKGRTEQANELAAFLRDLTRNSTIRELAERYRISKTSWGEYRSGSKILPWHLLERTVLDRVHDSRGRAELLAKARRLHTAALEAEQVQRPAPAAAAARAQRQAEEDLAHTERLTQALLQIAAVLQNSSPPHPEPASAAGDASSPDAGPADPVARQHLEQAQVHLERLQQIQDAAQQAQAAAQTQYVQAFQEQTPPESTDAARPEDIATAYLPAVRAADVQALAARAHSDVEEVHREVAVLWRQVSGEPMRPLVVRGEVLTRADNDLTSSPTEARPARRRPRRLGTGLAALATVVAAAGATAATMLYLRPAPPVQAAPPSAQAPVHPSLPAPATAPASATPSPSPSGSTPLPSSGPGVSETRDRGQAASPAPTPHTPAPGTSAAPPAENQPAPQQPVEPGPRPWTNMNSGKCLEIRRDSTENGATANQWTCNNSPTQQWKTTNPTGWGTIVNANSGLCLEIRRDATGNGATANQWKCNDSATQNWHWKPAPGGGWNLVNANSGKCLEITAGSADNGALAAQRDCNSSPAQKWT
ncbi:MULTISPECIES: RICIN domain-containing protein [unclassified Streptomyces]|uniref:RICIN domain-containing protein n=1 Tax=unclassified Streptomyces TaxID=2593676 RepID=UPI0004BD2ADD|nr:MULTISPECIES: RICIN domain-containing protein [unclassified Streptomyces]